MCSGLRGRGVITVQRFGKEMSSSHIHRQNTKYKKKKEKGERKDYRALLMADAG